MLDKLGRADGLFAYKQVRRTGGDENVQESLTIADPR
jgi:hypothetical protein